MLNSGDLRLHLGRARQFHLCAKYLRKPMSPQLRGKLARNRRYITDKPEPLLMRRQNKAIKLQATVSLHGIAQLRRQERNGLLPTGRKDDDISGEPLAIRELQPRL